MIIKKLKLKNVRSYKDGLVDFPLGKTLFEGDVGSGKSTILMAVEFALFGLGDVRPGALLKSGQTTAEVGLIFSVDGREYTVTRGLEMKRDSINQTEGLLETPEGAMHLSPGELKEKILGILDFKEPVNARAQSVIYRYAIFTPQEEMKAILTLGSELRVQTLRKAFGLEDYKMAADNAGRVLTAINNRIVRVEAASSDLETLLEGRRGVTKELESKRGGYSNLQTQKEEAERLVKWLKGEEEILHSKEIRLSSATTEVALFTDSAHAKTQEVDGLAEQIEGIDVKVAPLVLKVRELGGVSNPSPKYLYQIEEEIQQHKKRQDDAQREDTRIGEKLRDYQTVQIQGVCPICDTEADPAKFLDKVKMKIHEKEEALRLLDLVTNHGRELETLLENKRTFDQAQKDMVLYQERVSEYNRQLADLRERLKKGREDEGELQRKLLAAHNELKGLDGVRAELEGIKKKLSDAETDFRKLSEKAAKAGQEIEDEQKKIDEAAIRIETKEGYRKKAQLLKEHQIWIEGYFMPTLEAIEKHVMITINQEFNAEFQKWFAMLVEDPGKDAFVDDTFTPIIKQDGSEQDVRYLSGGERTSVALAYRLALNSVVRRVSTGMQSNLLILDEPTDGFSKEQLSRVREILDELNCPQLVMVSHEKELESFADQIVRITKVNGISKVDAGAVA